MNYGKMMLRNTLHQSLGRFFPMIVAFILGPIIARNFGVDIYGEYSTGLVLVGFFTALCDIGLGIYIVKEGAVEKEKISYLTGTSMLINFILRIFVTIIIVIWINHFNYSNEIKKITYILLIGNTLGSFTQIMISTLQIFNEFKIISISQILMTIFSIIVAALTIQLKLNIYNFVWIQTIIGILPIFLFYFICKKFINFEIKLNKIKQIIKESYLFGVSGVLYILYYKIDSIMLSVYSQSSEVGEYMIAYKFVEMPLTLTGIVTISVLGIFTKLFKENKAEFSEYYNKILMMMSIIGIPTGFGLYSISRSLILWMYGSEFINAAYALEIISFSVTIRFLAVVTGMIFTVGNLMKVKVKIQAVVCLINLILNYLTIPKYGIYGAGISTLITEGLILIVYVYITTKLNYKIKIYKDIIIMFLISILMSIILKKIEINNILIQILVGGIFYMISIYFIFIQKIKKLFLLKA